MALLSETVIVKDHSRLGRNRLVIGTLLEEDFERYGVRYIAITNEIDTAKDDNDMLHFRSLMNDYHLKDLSDKIKTVFGAKA